MPTRIPFRRFLALLCVSALLGVQVFGVARGFVCDCTGILQWTAQDHCHGPHHDDCHRDEAPGHEHREGDGSGERHDHQQLRDEVDLRLAQASVEAPSLVPLLIAFFGGEALWTAPVVARAPSNKVPADTGSPPGVAVARTTVLLI